MLTAITLTKNEWGIKTKQVYPLMHAEDQLLKVQKVFERIRIYSSL